MSEHIPTPDIEGDFAPVLTYSPLVLPVPGRPVDLHLRVSAPATGTGLPILLLSHGHGPSNYVSSSYGYAPLANFYAAHGFVVVQPTHLDSATLGLRDASVGEAPLYWRSRATDMQHVLDRLEEIEAAVPMLGGRLDSTKVAVVGHSMGGHTASLLLGARLNDPETGTLADLRDDRIRAGVLLAAPGRGGEALSAGAAQSYPCFRTVDFSSMTTPSLVMGGAEDNDPTQHLTVVGADWHRDPYDLSPGARAFVSLNGAGHGLGGVAGHDLAETDDESPRRVAAVQRLSWAFLRSELFPQDPAWQDARSSAISPAMGRLEVK